MATSTLDPDVDVTPDRDVQKGHGTDALGPSDTSDTGSDISGGPGLVNEERLPGGPADERTDYRADAEAPQSAGRDIGDAGLASDSDAEGTGERASAGRDPVQADGADRGFDRTIPAGEAGLGTGLDEAEEALRDPVGEAGSGEDESDEADDDLDETDDDLDDALDDLDEGEYALDGGEDALDAGEAAVEGGKDVREGGKDALDGGEDA